MHRARNDKIHVLAIERAVRANQQRHRLVALGGTDEQHERPAADLPRRDLRLSGVESCAVCDDRCPAGRARVECGDAPTGELRGRNQPRRPPDLVAQHPAAVAQLERAESIRLVKLGRVINRRHERSAGSAYDRHPVGHVDQVRIQRSRQPADSVRVPRVAQTTPRADAHLGQCHTAGDERRIVIAVPWRDRDRHRGITGTRDVVDELAHVAADTARMRRCENGVNQDAHLAPGVLQ